MGYCILVVHGLNRLCAMLNRWGSAALTISMLVLLLLFSWKTVQQNEIWLSRESLFSAMNNLGTLTHDTKEAELYYKQALDINPQHNRALFNLGNLLNSDLHNNYGVFLVDTGDGERAAVHYQHAVQLKPSHYVAMVDILTPLGALYYNTGRYEEALELYREAVSLQPDNHDIWLALAQVLAMAGHAKEAEKMTLSIITKSNSCIECYRLLSAIYSKQGNHTESYKLAVELKPDQSQAWMNMGGIQHIKGDYVAARTYYQKALLLSPGSKLLKENLAKLDRLEKKLQGG
ncbi:Transmembrane and TPR repeat-containing protein 1 [Bagarius yarrelli]|uniref:Transmembrane and TPR repeat-containing protein 1 n=1 Tax=Bagarius yarrelli TaxID=175774 RepID=A0A556THL1_BAGYA|nr:Transmembrane and TPR repeat-containing protein 1 [Bagarius yarrelli]